MNTILLFVYGTLKRGGVRNGVIAAQKYLGEARTVPRYALVDLGSYPGLVHAKDGHHVHGELFEVDSALIDTLDAVEGAPALFAMEDIELEGHDRLARSYFYQQDATGRPRIASGRWQNAPPPP
jgi:gamma-glutamylcyclotransferase (GGCT)/AIG2-like uncharacterized protein YtfP